MRTDRRAHGDRWQPPPAPPPAPLAGLDAWTSTDAPGAVRLPWLPVDPSLFSVVTVFVVLAFAVMGAAAIAGGSAGHRVLGVAFLAGGVAITWLALRRRAALRAGTFVAIDPAQRVLHVAHADMDIDLTLPFDTLRAVAILTDLGGGRVVVQRADAPAVMVSGVLPLAAAEAAAEALARRLRLPSEAPGPLPEATARLPAAPVRAEDVPAPPAADMVERIALVENPEAVGRQATWFGAIMIAVGLGWMMIKDMPPLLRWGAGFGFVAFGIFVIRQRLPREAMARNHNVLIDRQAGTIKLSGLNIAAPLASARRVLVDHRPLDYSTVAIDFFDRPSVSLEVGLAHGQAEALGKRLGEAIGCPVEPAG